MRKEMKTKLNVMPMDMAFKELEELGWEILPCDTPVPYYDNPVSCGSPAEIGDELAETMMFPGGLMPYEGAFFTRIKGDSMKDAELEQGDLVLVDCETTPHDNDVVLAKIDGESLIKGYFEDNDGEIWLIPQNEDYEAISLSEKSLAIIVGVISRVLKKSPRITSRSAMKYIQKKKAKMAPKVEVTPEQVSETIRRISSEVKAGRQWYAVFRPLVDVSFFSAKSYDAFVDMVRKEVPLHEHLPKRLELQRMAVGCFTKPVRNWREDNAPVQGTRFYKYKAIALQTFDLLGVEM